MYCFFCLCICMDFVVEIGKEEFIIKMIVVVIGIVFVFVIFFDENVYGKMYQWMDICCQCVVGGCN